MNLSRLRVCEIVDQRLIHLKSRTGLRPNVLCRLGFALSLNNPIIPNPDDYPPDSNRELSRYVLLGPWDEYFVALLKERCAYDQLDLDTDLEDQFRAHVNRGVLMLYDRVKNLGDLNRLVEESMRAFEHSQE